MLQEERVGVQKVLDDEAFVLELVLDGADEEIEETAAGVHVNEEVDVAGLVRLASSDRSEDADVARAMAFSNGQDLVAMQAEEIGGCHSHLG